MFKCNVYKRVDISMMVMSFGIVIVGYARRR